MIALGRTTLTFTRSVVCATTQNRDKIKHLCQVWTRRARSNSRAQYVLSRVQWLSRILPTGEKMPSLKAGSKSKTRCSQNPVQTPKNLKDIHPQHQRRAARLHLNIFPSAIRYCADSSGNKSYPKVSFMLTNRTCRPRATSSTAANSSSDSSGIWKLLSMRLGVELLGSTM